jgi:hypothetical protein
VIGSQPTRVPSGDQVFACFTMGQCSGAHGNATTD